ncbi:Rho GTPase activation protein, partial [Gorgonomyces haynaldii]
EGLYRKSGKQSQVNVILGALAKGDPVVLEDPNTYIDVSVICSALKQFFRDLPEPLFVSSLYKDLMDLARSKPTEDRGKQLKSMIQTMPSEHQQTLEYLIRHLVKIKSQSDKNLMTASNLGVCFGPTLVRPTVTTAQTEIAESTFRANIVESLITSFDEIFQ